MKRIALLLYSLALSLSAMAMSKPDSLSLEVTLQSRELWQRDSLQRYKPYELLKESVPLMVLGLSCKPLDKYPHRMRNTFVSNFHNSFDDYLQFSPAAIMLGLKAFGVEGRSSWGRMLTTDAMAVGMMAATVNLLKYTTCRLRPDGSSYNSFPSGHTATAFLMATLLSQEYGRTRSPLYSVLGYSLATATAMGRQLNNRHWLSDVLMGAGIGILSGKLAYYFSELIFKDRGLLREHRLWQPKLEGMHYNSFGVSAAYIFPLEKALLPEGLVLHNRGGLSLGLTMEHQIDKNWGLEAILAVDQTVPRARFKQKIEGIKEFQTPALSFYSAKVGGHYQLPLHPRWGIGLSLLGGMGKLRSYQLQALLSDGRDKPLLRIETPRGIGLLDLKLYLLNISGYNFGLKVYAGYEYVWGRASYRYNTLQGMERLGSKSIHFHRFFSGVNISALLWRG